MTPADLSRYLPPNERTEPTPRARQQISEHEVGRRRSRQHHSRCIGSAAALAPLPGTLDARSVSRLATLDRWRLDEH
jgi:hypothetical protein